MKRINTAYEWLAKREGLLWVCLLLQIAIYWTLAFVIPSASEFVAYQRY